MGGNDNSFLRNRKVKGIKHIYKQTTLSLTEALSLNDTISISE